MPFVLLVLTIGVLNLCLGYAAAVYLGYGPPSLWDAWEVLGICRGTQGTWGDSDLMAGDATREPKRRSASPPETSSPPDPEETPDPAAEPAISDLDALRRTVAQGASSLADFTARMKAGGPGQRGATAWNFVARLQESCKEYLQHLSEVAERPPGDASWLGELAASADEVQQLILEQAAQLETTLSNLQYMDFESSCSSAVARLREDAKKTLSAARRLQKALEAASQPADDQQDNPTADGKEASEMEHARA
jgi:hypothetical protein